MTGARRVYRGKRARAAPLGAVACIFITVIVLGYVTYYFQTIVKPIIKQLAEIKATSMMVSLINDVMRDEFRQDTDINNLLIIKTNNDGNIELVQANTSAMNLLMSELLKELCKRYKSVEPENFKVPLGALLGSQILSETGPNVKLKVLPLAVSKTDFKTEFISEGINQTKYKVYVELTCKVRVLAPFSSDITEVEKKVLIAEAVILGRVPNSYVFVPKDNANLHLKPLL